MTRFPILTVAAFLVAAPAFAQTPPQTPAQLLQQAEDLIRQARTQLTEPPPARPPVTTTEDFIAAFKVGAQIDGKPGVYKGNFVIAVDGTTCRCAGVVFESLDPLTAALTITANDAMLMGLEVVQTEPQPGIDPRDTVVIGDFQGKTEASYPQRVQLLGVNVHTKNGIGHRGISMHGSHIKLESSSVTGYLESGRQGQAIWINGPGPYVITKNVIEGSGENLLAGGADPGLLNLVPTDITITGNTFRKPAAWRAVKGSVANLLELKNARRVLIEGNTFDGNWVDAQAGHAIVFTVRNQSGKCPWCVVDEIVFRRNIVTNTPDGFCINVLGLDDQIINGVSYVSQQTKRITIDHNLCLDSPKGIQIINGVSEALVVTNNTFPKITGQFLSFSRSARPKVYTPLTFSANVTTAGMYGISGNGTVSMGLPSLLQWATVTEWNGNVIEHWSDDSKWTYPTGTGNVLLAAGGMAPLLDPTTKKLISGTAGY